MIVKFCDAIACGYVLIHCCSLCGYSQKKFKEQNFARLRFCSPLTTRTIQNFLVENILFQDAMLQLAIACRSTYSLMITDISAWMKLKLKTEKYIWNTNLKMSELKVIKGTEQDEIKWIMLFSFSSSQFVFFTLLSSLTGTKKLNQGYNCNHHTINESFKEENKKKILNIMNWLSVDESFVTHNYLQHLSYAFNYLSNYFLFVAFNCCLSLLCYCEDVKMCLFVECHRINDVFVTFVDAVSIPVVITMKLCIEYSVCNHIVEQSLI